MTAERKVASSIPGIGPILRVLKITENRVPNKCFRAKYLDTQMNCIFFNNIDFFKLCFIVVRLMSTALVLFFAKCASDNFQILRGVTNKWCL